MKALIEKEIRLLLPAFAGAILLATVPGWFFPYDSFSPKDYSPYFLWFGVALLGLSTFGREIGFRTLPFMLAQPMDRARVWRTKGLVLAFFVVITFGGWLLSRILLSWLTMYELPALRDLTKAGVFTVVMVSGAIWMTLLLRQVAAAFWLTFLVPMVTVIAVEAAGGGDWIILTILAVYAAAGFFFAHRQFAGLQDTAWTGGFVTLGSGRVAVERATPREHRAWGTLIRKELKLNEFTLAGMAGLFVVHLGVVALRKYGAETFSRTTLSTLEMFGIVWLFVPLVAGSQSVSEERQLGILDGLLCLPFSRRAQFWIKLVFVLVVGGLLSATLLWTAESIGRAIGAGRGIDFGGMDDSFSHWVLCFLGLALAGFWASTLTRSIVQGMAAAVVISLAFFGLFQLGFQVPLLWRYVAYPALLVTVLWLAYGNFRWVFESGLRWRRNVFGFCGMALITLGLTYAVSYRFWELAMPVDDAHGPARLPAGKFLKVHGYGGTGLAVVLPDGRLWTDRIANDGGRKSLSGDQFVPGSNWVDAYADNLDTGAVRADGTLWVSEKLGPRGVNGRPPAAESPIPLVQFGAESNWQSIARYPTVLLKRDGTLWRWGTNEYDKNYLGLRAFTPQQILEGGSDWATLLRGVGMVYAWKKDGSAWAVQTEVSHDNIGNVREPNLDRVKFKNLSSYPSILKIDAGVREDGTLCYWKPALYAPGSRLVQIGNDSDWAEVAGAFTQMVALKTDGTLWSWDLLENRSPVDIGKLQDPPKQIGTRNDWVAVAYWYNRSVGLSADGTFRYLPGSLHIGWDYEMTEALLAPSRRTSKIENIFGAQY